MTEIKKPGLYTAGLVLGIVAICLFFVPFIPFICGLLALIFGAVVYSKGYKKIIPMFLGTLGILITIIEVILLLIFKDQIKANIERKTGRVVDNIQNNIIETTEELSDEEKEQMRNEAINNINNAIDEVQRSLNETLESSKIR